MTVMNKQQIKRDKLKGNLEHRRNAQPRHGLRQRGAAALLITLILVVIAGLSGLVVNKAAFNEQKLSGIDLRSKEVYAAAVGTLEYGANVLELAYLNADDGLAWQNGVLTGLQDDTVVAAAFVNGAAGATIDQQADNYTPTVVYTLLTDESASPAIIEIAATATAVGDSQVTKTITVQYLISAFGTPSFWDAPPLVVEECLSNVTGTPDIYSDSVAIGSLNGGDACVDPGFFDLNGDSMAIGDPEIKTGMNSDPPLSLHETLFGSLTAEKLKKLSELEEGSDSSDRTVYYIDADFSDPTGDTAWNGNSWNDNIGSGTTGGGPHMGPYTVTHSTVLYFDESVGCPPVNGNVEIWGIVFYESASCDTQIGAQGGGKADIYGTVAFSGDLSKYTANTNIHDVDLSAGGGGLDDIKIVTALPGSWIDF